MSMRLHLLVNVVQTVDARFGIGLDPPKTPGVKFDPLFATDFALTGPDGDYLEGRRSVIQGDLGRESSILVPSCRGSGRVPTAWALESKLMEMSASR
jgi:hypothetical protein